jgi:hypothetical protein
MGLDGSSADPFRSVGPARDSTLFNIFLHPFQSFLMVTTCPRNVDDTLPFHKPRHLYRGGPRRYSPGSGSCGWSNKLHLRA